VESQDLAGEIHELPKRSRVAKVYDGSAFLFLRHGDMT